MQSEISGEQIPFGTIAEELGRKRRQVLLVLDDRDGNVANTKEIRVDADLPYGSVTYHLNKLQGWELIQDTEQRENVGQGSDARIFALTPRGEKFIDEMLSEYKRDDGESDRVAENRAEISKLSGRVDTIEEGLEHDIRQLQGQVNDIEDGTPDDIEKLQGQVKQLGAAVDAMYDALTAYDDELASDIEQSMQAKQAKNE